jgi:SAM-dependent methyltransferase
MAQAPSLPTYPTLPAPSALAFGAQPLPAPPPAFAVRLVLGLRRRLLQLADRLSPAEVSVFDQCTGIANTALLGAAARFGIADYLAEHGASRAEAIAAGLGLNADSVHRTLRALSNIGIFAMSSDGAFSNNRLSQVLRSGQLSRGREWALYFSSGSNASAWLDFARTLQTGESAFNRVHGMNVWQWFEAHPDEREIFAHCMMGLTVLDAPLVASAYPFGEVQRLCDVGGGRGALLSEIVLRHPHLQAVLYDSAGVLASAAPLLAERGVSERIELLPGSFFDSVPAGCDAYLMKNILHDWDDPTSLRVLRNIRNAAAPGGRLILCERLVERTSRDATATRVDLQMMIACDQGRERGLGEFQALLGKAGFHYRRVFAFPTLAIIEADAV